MKIPEGFTKEGWQDAYEFEIPGSFGFTVSVKTEDWDGDPVQPSYRVCLPHQCDSWDIVGGDVGDEERSHEAALELLRAFIKEAQRAYDVLSRAKVVEGD